MCVCLLVTQSCPTLCDPMDYSPPGSSVHGLLQARILEWVANSFSRASSQPMDQTQVSCIAGIFHTTGATRETLHSTRSRAQLSVMTQTDGMGRGCSRGKRYIYTYLWLIHIFVQQKPTCVGCKAIIFQLKKLLKGQWAVMVSGVARNFIHVTTFDSSHQQLRQDLSVSTLQMKKPRLRVVPQQARDRVEATAKGLSVNVLSFILRLLNAQTQGTRGRAAGPPEKELWLWRILRSN